MPAHNHSHDHHHHHAHGHGHHHHHHHHGNGSTGRIRLALILNLVFAAIELVGGLWTGSVAILSDALHDFGDSLSLGLSYFFEKAARRDARGSSYSYGYHRLSLLAAFISAVVLVSGSLFILAQAIPRLVNPVQPRVDGMIALACLGVAVNGFAAWRVSFGKTMNERVISWHLVEDVLGWVVVLITSLVMLFVDLPILDPILSIFFTLYLLWNVGKSLRATVHLFLQGTPDSIDMPALRQAIAGIAGVSGVHDLHLWSLDGESHVLTMHAVVQQLEDSERIRRDIKALVQGKGRIHCTIELETTAVECPELNCVQD